MKKISIIKYLLVILTIGGCTKEVTTNNNIEVKSNTSLIEVSQETIKDYTLCWYGDRENISNTDPFEYKLTITLPKNNVLDIKKIEGQNYIEPYKKDSIIQGDKIIYHLTYRPPIFDEMIENLPYYHPYNEDFGSFYFDPMEPTPVSTKRIFKRYYIGLNDKQLILYTKINTAPYADMMEYYVYDDPELSSLYDIPYMQFFRNRNNVLLDDDLIYGDNVRMWIEQKDNTLKELNFNRDFTNYPYTDGKGWYMRDHRDILTYADIKDEQLKEVIFNLYADRWHRGGEGHNVEKSKSNAEIETKSTRVNHFVFKDSYGDETDIYYISNTLQTFPYEFSVIKQNGKYRFLETVQTGTYGLKRIVMSDIKYFLDKSDPTEEEELYYDSYKTNKISSTKIMYYTRQRFKLYFSDKTEGYMRSLCFQGGFQRIWNCVDEKFVSDGIYPDGKRNKKSRNTKVKNIYN